MIRNAYAYMENCMLMHFIVTWPPERKHEVHIGEVARGVYFRMEPPYPNVDHRV
jgi:hypothetical protein